MHVIAHGGAGGTPDDPETRQGVLNDAVVTGASEPTPLDAVVTTVARLENSPRFNAGIGGAVQADGVVRTDAGIMTEDRRVGAVCSMEGVAHAADVARVVLEETPHVLVSGRHALRLAEAYGVETGVDCWSERTHEKWADLDHPDPDDPRDQLSWLRDHFAGNDTVGAVSSDGEHVAACTSTGGRWAALAGRVGDVPQVGSGFFCTYAGGASATGAGEDITRVTLSRRAVDHLELGRSAQEAAELAIEEFEDITGSGAGIIVMDQKGNTGSAFNTDLMQTAIATSD